MLHHQDFIQLGQNFVGHILRLILFSYHLILISLSSSLVDSLVEPMYVLHHQVFIQLRTEFCRTYITLDPLLIPPHLVLLIMFTSGAYVLHHQDFIQLNRILLDIYYA